MLSRHHDLPLDAIVLTLCVLAAIKAPTTAAATLSAVIVTALLGLYWLVTLLDTGASGADADRRTERPRLAIALTLLALVVVLPTLVAIGDRHATAPYRDIHDSPLQIELATGMLLHGQDYYRATYFGTPLERWWPIGPPNPALYHTDSLPLQEEVTVPALLAARATLGWFDERFIYLVALFSVIGLALHLGATPRQRLTLLAGLTLNPLSVPAFIAGQNDILVLAEVLGAVALARASRPRAALLLCGVALATKETALFMVPFLLLWLAGQARPTRPRSLRAWGRWGLDCAVWIGAPLLLSAGPFVLWDAHAFFESTVGFVAGTAPHPFPIRGLEGYGLGSLVLFGGLVRSSSAYWPFSIVQIGVTAPVTALLLYRQWRDNSLARAVGGYATVLLLVYYCGRFFHASFIAYVLALVVLAIGLEEPGRRSHLSLDFLLLLIVVPQVLERPTTAALAIVAAVAMGLLVLHALVDAACDGWNAAEGSRMGARTWRLHLTLVATVLGVVVVWPEWRAIVARHAAQPWNYVHDTAMQVEAAVRFLVAGRDFYAQSYLHTPMVHWYSSPAMSAALYHVDRLPFGIVASLPPYLLLHALIGWFDERFIYLPCLLVCAWVLLRLPLRRDLRLCAVVAVLLNPFFIPTLIYGQDDVVILALLLLALRALYRERAVQAAVWIGLACATKQTAFFLLPPYLFYLWATVPVAATQRERLWAIWRRGWPVLVLPLAWSLPFLLWNARAFLDGNIGFLSGTVAHSYPVRGIGAYGFGAVLLLRGVIRAPSDYYPFTLWEVAAAVPLLIVVLRRLRRTPTIAVMMAAYALLLGVSYFFSRFFQDSGLAYVVGALLLAALLTTMDGRVAAAPA